MFIKTFELGHLSDITRDALVIGDSTRAVEVRALRVDQSPVVEKITADQVRDLFDYRDGVLYWRHSVGNAVSGQVAGTHLHNRTTNVWVIRYKGRPHTRARLVWAWHHGHFPSVNVLHKNRDTLDDRLENLTIDRPNHRH